jgi:HK97 family phage portal protein
MSKSRRKQKRNISRNIENPAVPITHEGVLEKLGLLGSDSASGIRVTPERALANPAVYRAVSLISNAVAKTPLILYQRGANDSRERATEHPAYRLVKRQPHQLYTAFSYKQTLMVHALLWGNSYSYILRDETGAPQELMLLDPDQTTLKTEQGYYYYSTQIEQTEYRLPLSDVLHVKGLSSTGLLGWYTTQLLKDSLGLGIALQEYGARFFKNSARPSVVVILPPAVRGKDKIAEFKQQWAQVHQGLTQSHGIAALANGADVKTFGGDNEQSQFLQSREFDLIAVADALNINASKLGAKNNTSYGSLEMDERSYLSDSLDPWFVNIEQECGTKLLTESEKDEDSHYFEFNRKSLIQIDAKTELDLIVAQKINGVLGENESRRLLNLGDKDPSDTYWHPANVVVEGEEPEPVAQAQPEQPAVNSDQPTEAQKKLEAQTKKIVGKLFTRMQKAVESGKTDLTAHREVILENLSVWDKAEQWTDNLLRNLQDEINAVLPEQRAAVFERYSPDKLAEELW